MGHLPVYPLVDINGYVTLDYPANHAGKDILVYIPDDDEKTLYARLPHFELSYNTNISEI